MSAAAPPVVEIKVTGLTTRFGKNVVHRNLDLSAYRGEILCIVGGSGSGKTTLLRAMLGLDRPAADVADKAPFEAALRVVCREGRPVRR